MRTMFISVLVGLAVVVIAAASTADGDVLAPGKDGDSARNQDTRQETQETSAKDQETSNRSPASTGRTPRRTVPVSLPAFTAEREAAALRFVKQHHTQLGDLLSNLKTTNTNEYQKAIRDLFRTSERLAQTRERGDDERYRLELETWKVDSRIRLLAARLSMEAGNRQLKEDLHAALLKRIDLRLERFELDRSRLAERVEKLDEHIEKTKKQRQRQADQSLDRLLRLVQEPRQDDPKRRPPKRVPVTKTKEKPNQ